MQRQGGRRKKGEELARNSEERGKENRDGERKVKRENGRRKTKVKKEEEEEGKVQRGEEEKKEGPLSKWHWAGGRGRRAARLC